MKTKNAMQLKARVNTRAKEAGIPAQQMMQNYLYERLLERLSMTPWRDRVVVKGGMLIASMVGVNLRTTMDLDTTVRDLELTHESAEAAFREIIATRADDDWKFEFVRTEDIRETDDYPGIRVHLLARYAPLEVPLKVDVTTGDRITPGAVNYEYPLLFDDRSIHLMAYPLETVLAEKLETVVSRGVGNTRPRDFYDIHMLWKLRSTECDPNTLLEALRATSAERGSTTVMDSWYTTLSAVASSRVMQGPWEKYVKMNSYAANITLEETCETAKSIMRTIGWDSRTDTAV